MEKEKQEELTQYSFSLKTLVSYVIEILKKGIEYLRNGR